MGIIKNTLIFSVFCTLAQATLTFDVVFTTQAQTSLTPAEQALFTDGVNFWDDVIDGYQDGVSRTWTLTVDTFDQGPMNGGIVLGSAGASSLAISNVVPGSGLSAPWPDQFILSGSGQASFNTNAAAGALQGSVIRHEIGHALGIGTLWEDNEVYNDGVAGNHNRTLAGGTPGQYTGANAFAAYQAEFDSGATFIPIELDGGGGTAHGHWNEVTDNFGVENAPGFDGDPGDGSAAPTDALGRSLDDELLTGVLSGSAFLSNTTIQSLVDIGFTIEPDALVPEPSSALLACLGLFLIRRKR